MLKKEQKITYEKPQIYTPCSSGKTNNIKRLQAMGFGGIIKTKKETIEKN